ncbi:hypothetical protein BV22DRAFT_1041295 [Leucogyrophana mollusca]|uniref:Uncharacterized protein n=1 Tax=Leucogyrophana mollusca TaxID=85980 RepID=A0ACB8B2D1_9AGAM|nr:hypothetical protein BV22DRAFT_1041295 [Leucogyrophana mollusca]
MTPLDQGASSSHSTSGPSGPAPAFEDVEMALAPAVPDHPTRVQRDDDVDSMPDLQSVSDSSDESNNDAVEVERMPVLRPVEDDHDSAWTDDEDDLPPLEPIAGNRRARVEDDIDEARDRRHPSQRVGSPATNRPLQPQPSNQPQPQQPQFPGTQGFFEGFMAPLFDAMDPPDAEGDVINETGEGNVNPPPTGNNANPGGAPRGIPVLTAGFTFTIPIAGPPQFFRHGAGAPNAAGQGQHSGENQGPPLNFFNEPGAREELLASVAAFFQEIQNLGHGLDDNREDPERAKRLVDGLEVVPIGLVKRLERVGGAPGGHVDDASGTSDLSSTPGCAICWDTLLDAENDGFKPKESPEDRPSSNGDTSSNTNPISDPAEAEASSSEHAPPSLSPDPSSTSSVPEEPKIISLPCAHVFHASCLLPWFSRARNVTCPTCRFNIDPENLTYTPRRAFNPPPPQGQARDPAAAPAPAAAPDAPAGEGASIPAFSPQPTTSAATAPSHDIPAAESVPAPPAPAPAPPAPGARPPGLMPFAAIPGFTHIFPLAGLAAHPPQSGAPQGGPPFDGQPNPPAPGAQRARAQSMPNFFTAGDQAPLGNEFFTIGVDMFVGGPPGDIGAGGPPPNEDMQTILENMFRGRGAGAAPIFAQPPGHNHPPTAAVPPTQGPAPQPPRPGTQWFPRSSRPMPPHRERKVWTLPPAPGPSLRQRVEQKEREAGLRCFDISCGIGPSDEDPLPDLSSLSIKQVSITPLDAATVGTHVCPHKFHPACLVSAERVAGWGGEDKTEPQIEVSCPVCRAVGCVTREEWEEGVSAL